MKKIKVLKFVIILLILLLLIISALIFVYIKTDFFKTPDQLFKKYLLDGVVQISRFNIKPYNEIFEKAKSEKVEIVSESERDYTSEPESYYYFEEESETEKKKILVKETIKIDKANKNMAYLMDSKCEEKDFLKFNFLKTDNTYGIFVPELHNKYLALENRDFKNIAQVFGASDEILEKIPNELPKVSFSEEENIQIKELMAKYAKKISDSIDISFYAKEKYEMNLDNESIKGTKFILTIPEEKLEEIASNIYEELENDQEFWKLIDGTVVEYFANYIKSMKEFSDTISKNLEEVAERRNELETDIYKNENVTEENLVEENAKEVPQNVKIAVYENKGETVKIEILYDDGASNEITINNKEDFSNILIRNVEPKTEYNEVAEENIIDLSNNYVNNRGEFSLLIQEKYNQEDIENEKKKNQNENSYLASFYDNEYYASKYQETELNLKLITEFNKDVIKTNMLYNSKGEENSDEEFDIVIKFDPNIEVPLLTDENKLVINDYTKEEFIALGTELKDNLYRSAEETPDSLIGSKYKQKIEEELEKIENYRERIADNVKEAIESNLNEYKSEIEMSGEANIEEYLGIEKIKDEAGFFIDEMELIDGTTIKCLVNDYTYFVKISIDGNEWVLTDIQVLYSKDGTLENAG